MPIFSGYGKWTLPRCVFDIKVECDPALARGQEHTQGAFGTLGCGRVQGRMLLCTSRTIHIFAAQMGKQQLQELSFIPRTEFVTRTEAEHVTPGRIDTAITEHACDHLGVARVLDKL